jgi:hypothetical protein
VGPGTNRRFLRQPLQGGDWEVKGYGFTPRQRVELYIAGIPNWTGGSIQLVTTADALGQFKIGQSVRCTSENTEDAFAQVEFSAFDLVAGRWARATHSAEIWVC